MNIKKCWPGTKYLMISMLLSQGVSSNALAHGGEVHPEEIAPTVAAPPACQVLTAARLFDGINFPQENKAVLIETNKVAQVGTPEELSKLCSNRLDLGDATIMPGFIESHAHITFQNVLKNKVLEHGITTVQDTGGPLMAAEGGQGSLRLLSTGPIIQAPGGYPLNVFGGGAGGYDKIGIPVASVAEAETVVDNLVNGGATAIKIALEPGGEPGAPWMQPHGDQPVPQTPWNLLPQEIVNAIVAKAHAHGKRVIAHVGENEGFKRALAGNIDELAHTPCAAIDDNLLQQAVQQGITFVTTIDTLGSCVDGHSHQGIHSNVMSLANKGAKFIYGSEIGHDNVPWGINGEEFHMMLHLGSGESIDFTDVVNVFKAATSKAGERLGIARLGTLTADAPADVIAVRGNPFERFKLLEYPDLVMSGGRVVVNKFNHHDDAECLFAWAEHHYAELFAPAGAYSQVTGNKTYRHYSATHAHLSVSSDQHVYYQGADGIEQNVGPLSYWRPVAGCQ
ncbi:MAG: amidohydrolase family protein [Methylobacter sp.]|nr:amidohydrolase family protein [Methylobacter sp.]MDP2100781.1 amidohydrolase family protein [Methylobacter sp.]MDP2427052.1 amidohydrolase family protein [Methylobacter sp.]MDP3053030.1 amidohydrolase family protein [Methylobacter sp.]MDP3362895.1 amidohydrolase family protein [Methylobacter sp.]